MNSIRLTTRWVLLGALSGLLAGISSWLFLQVLDRVTETRLNHPSLVWGLPAAGLAMGLFHHHFGGRAVMGKSLILEQIHQPTEWVPRRMAPMVLIGTWITHLFGGSAGREGTAIQMSGSLTDHAARLLRLSTADRRLLLQVSLAGGFGAVFGVPFAGTMFALEVPTVGRLRADALLPALTAAVVGHTVVLQLGYHHAVQSVVSFPLTVHNLAGLLLIGCLSGLAGAGFAKLSLGIRNQLSTRVRWSPLRPFLGGLAVLGLSLIAGRQYLGLSLPLAAAALAGATTSWWIPILKLVFTSLTFGSGLPGGEVTPLFVIGATLGATVGGAVGLPVAAAAAMGFVAVFSGAAKTPIACAIMGVELFGSSAAAPFLIVCALAFVCSGRTGIYKTQRWAAAGPNPADGAIA